MHKQQRAIHLRQGYGGLKAKMQAQKKSFAAKPRDPRTAAHRFRFAAHRFRFAARKEIFTAAFRRLTLARTTPALCKVRW